MITSAIKKQTSVCCSISLNPYMVFQEKRKAILLLVYIADVSCITNCSFYMRTLSLFRQHFFRTLINALIPFVKLLKFQFQGILEKVKIQGRYLGIYRTTFHDHLGCFRTSGTTLFL